MEPLLPVCDLHEARCCPLCRPADRLEIEEGHLYFDPRTGHTFHIHVLDRDMLTADGAGWAPQLRLRFYARSAATFAALVPLGQGSCPDCEER